MALQSGAPQGFRVRVKKNALKETSQNVTQSAVIVGQNQKGPATKSYRPAYLVFIAPPWQARRSGAIS